MRKAPSRDELRATQERSERLKALARDTLDKARNTAQVSANRRALVRLEAKKKS